MKEWRKIKHCKHNGKYCYESESKALRAVSRYEDIYRHYLCPHCHSWHTTSVGRPEAVMIGLVEPRKEEEEGISADDIKKQLALMQKKDYDKKAKGES